MRPQMGQINEAAAAAGVSADTAKAAWAAAKKGWSTTTNPGESKARKAFDSAVDAVGAAEPRAKARFSAELDALTGILSTSAPTPTPAPAAPAAPAPAPTPAPAAPAAPAAAPVRTPAEEAESKVQQLASLASDVVQASKAVQDASVSLTTKAKDSGIRKARGAARSAKNNTRQMNSQTDVIRQAADAAKRAYDRGDFAAVDAAARRAKAAKDSWDTLKRGFDNDEFEARCYISEGGGSFLQRRADKLASFWVIGLIFSLAALVAAILRMSPTPSIFGIGGATLVVLAIIIAVVVSIALAPKQSMVVNLCGAALLVILSVGSGMAEGPKEGNEPSVAPTEQVAPTQTVNPPVVVEDRPTATPTEGSQPTKEAASQTL